MEKELIITALLVVLSIPSFLGWGQGFVFLFLVPFCVSGYFADEGKTIRSRELLVGRNALAIIAAFGVGIFLLMSTSNFKWALSICLSFGLICLVGKRKYIIWAIIWVLFTLVLAKGFDLLIEKYSTIGLPWLSLICIPVLAIKVLDVLACAVSPTLPTNGPIT